MKKEGYDDAYYSGRNFTDKKRLESFDLEKEFIDRYIDTDKSNICDVGCSTGEFLEHVKWRGNRYGMEINNNVIKIAESRDISFDKNIKTEENYFDVCLFRGVIQHLPEPFTYLQHAHKSLKKGAHIVFLATPNANSLV